MGWYSQSLYKWIRFSGAKKSKYCKTISSLPFTKCFLAVPGWLKKAFCWVLHSEDYLVYTTYKCKTQQNEQEFAFFTFQGSCHIFYSEVCSENYLQGFFSPVYVRSTTAFWSWCAGPAHKIESALYLLRSQNGWQWRWTKHPL